MKLFICLMLLTLNAFAQAPSAIMGQISKTITTAGTPERISANDLFVRLVCFQCSGANSGNLCYIGTSSAGALAAAGMALVKPTATIPNALVCWGSLDHNNHPRINVKNLWGNVATNADEVNVFYVE